MMNQRAIVGSTELYKGTLDGLIKVRGQVGTSVSWEAWPGLSTTLTGSGEIIQQWHSVPSVRQERAQSHFPEHPPSLQGHNLGHDAVSWVQRL